MTIRVCDLKPQAHASGLEMFERCGEQFRRRYLENEIRPPAVALVIGGAVHVGIETDMRRKVETGSLAGLEEIQAAGTDALRARWGDGVTIDEEDGSNVEAVKSGAIDLTAALIGLHHAVLAPVILPIPGGVERKFLLEMSGYPFDLAGTIDLDEGQTVRETKTAKRAWTQDQADGKIQLSVYSLAKKILDGIEPSIAIDCLVKTKKPKAVTVKTTRTSADYLAFLSRFEFFSKCMGAGLFPPSSPDSWCCSKKWCGYWGDCPYASKRVSILTKGE